MRVIFMGSSDFGIPAMTAIRGGGHVVAAVVTTPARPKGRGLQLRESAVAGYCRSEGIGPVLTPADLSDPAFIESLNRLEADLFVAVAFRILPERVFTLPRRGTYNIHASLLPAYRGPAPIQRAIENGERTTGVTVFRIDAGVDTGSIVMQRETGIGDTETAPQVYARLSVLGGECLRDVLPRIADGSVRFARQDERLATRAPKLKKEEGRIDWSQDASAIFNKIRAFKPFPGTHTVHDGRRLHIEWATVSPEGDAPAAHGEITRTGPDGFDVRCGRGTLRVTAVKPEGKNSMDAGSFLRGTPLKTGTRLT